MTQGETYEQFVDKFKPKLTTDDCYTPPEVYDVVARWAVKEYGWEDREIVRPFYPGHFIPDKWGTYRFVPDYRRPVLDEVMTISEASERYGVPVTTIKSACAGQKGNPPAFTEYECRKSGKTWMVTKAGMDRLYGGHKDGKD